jgi:hypothetical protein
MNADHFDVEILSEGCKMKKHVRVQLACVLLLSGAAVTSAIAATATSQTASVGLTSTLNKGIVSIMTDPTLAGGRLIIKVVAHNPTAEPKILSAADVHVFTAAGKPVPVLGLDQLIAEVSGATDSRSRDHQSSNYSRPQASTSATGELDVTGITGASDAVGRTVSTQSSGHAAADDPAVQQQIDGLKAGILQSVTIAPGTAAGGQLVTDKIKFPRKEEKALRVVVDFNGEQHEFNFEAPPAG